VALEQQLQRQSGGTATAAEGAEEAVEEQLSKSVSLCSSTLISGKVLGSGGGTLNYQFQ